MIAAPWLAALLVQAVRAQPGARGRRPRGAAARLDHVRGRAIGGGLLALVALTIPTLASGVSIAGRAGRGRAAGRPDAAAAARAWTSCSSRWRSSRSLQLRLYGAPITRTRARRAGRRPAARRGPAIGLLAGAVLAIRIVPRLAELAERVLARGRRPRAGARRPAGRPTAAALHPRRAAADPRRGARDVRVGARRHLDARARATRRRIAAGADVRVDARRRAAPSRPGRLGEALRAVPGVTAATPVVGRAIQLGTTLRDGDAAGHRRGGDGGHRADARGRRRATRRSPRCARLGDARRAGPGHPDPDGHAAALAHRRLGVRRRVDGFEPFPRATRGCELRASSCSTRDGRIARLPAARPARSDGGRLVVDLAGPDGAGLPLPAHRSSPIQLGVTPGGNLDGRRRARWTSRARDEPRRDEGDAWTPARASRAAARMIGGGGAQDVDAPARCPSGSTSSGCSATQRVDYQRRCPGPTTPRRARRSSATGASSTRTGAAVGRHAHGERVRGARSTCRILGDGRRLPDAGPGASRSRSWTASRSSSSGSRRGWRRPRPPSGGSRRRRRRARRSPRPSRPARSTATDVVDRTAVEERARGRPLGLGVIGILGLGSIAALVFAAIGFLVTSRVSTTERLGELALLKALGLAPRQLLAWLSAEGVALLVVGLTAGVAAGAAARVARAAVRDAHRRPARPPCRRPSSSCRSRRSCRRWCWAAAAGGRDRRARAPAAARRPDERGPPREGRVAWPGRGSPCGGSRDDRAADARASLVLVLVTALLAALAPRVLAGLADDAVRAEVAAAQPVRPGTSRCSQDRASGRGPADDPLAARREAARPRARADLPGAGPVADRETGARPSRAGRFRVDKPTTDPAFVAAADPGGHRPTYMRYVEGGRPTSDGHDARRRRA